MRLVLQSLEIDLELGPAIGWRRIEQVGGQHVEGIGEVADEPDLGLDLAVLEQRQIRRRPSDLLTELGEGEPRAAAGFPYPLSEHERVELRHVILRAGLRHQERNIATFYR